MKTTRRNAIRTAASAALAAIVAVPRRLIAAIVPGRAAPTVLPPFPTADLPPDEILRRLILWDGGPRSAALGMLSSIGNGSSFGATTDDQAEHVFALVEELEDWLRSTSPNDDDAHDEVIAQACRRFGYDHRISRRKARYRMEHPDAVA